MFTFGQVFMAWERIGKTPLLAIDQKTYLVSGRISMYRLLLMVNSRFSATRSAFWHRLHLNKMKNILNHSIIFLNHRTRRSILDEIELDFRHLIKERLQYSLTKEWHKWSRLELLAPSCDHSPQLHPEIHRQCCFPSLLLIWSPSQVSAMTYFSWRRQSPSPARNILHSLLVRICVQSNTYISKLNATSQQIIFQAPDMSQRRNSHVTPDFSSL